jgi:hypothetical protein
VSRKLAVVLVVVLVLSLAGGSVARTHYCGLWQDKVDAAQEQRAAFIAAGGSPLAPVYPPPPRPWYC